MIFSHRLLAEQIRTTAMPSIASPTTLLLPTFLQLFVNTEDPLQSTTIGTTRGEGEADLEAREEAEGWIIEEASAEGTRNKEVPPATWSPISRLQLSHPRT